MSNCNYVWNHYCVSVVERVKTIFRESESVDLSFDDWLDGIQKTVKASIQEQQDQQSEGKSSEKYCNSLTIVTGNNLCYVKLFP